MRAVARVPPETFLTAYCAQMESFSKLPVLAVARFQVHGLGASAPISQILANAERSTPLHSQEHLTMKSGKGRVFRSAPPLLRRLRRAERAKVLEAFGPYVKTLAPERQHLFQQFRPLDVAFKVVGTGSVGLRDFCVYMEGNGRQDPLFLQMKEEPASAYAAYLPKSAVPGRNNGERAAAGQRAMQLESDPMLGWTRMDGRDYLVRQLNDHKAALEITTIDEAGLRAYAQVCGELLARGHARSGEAALIAGYLGGGRRFRNAMMEFGAAYAAQTTADWKAMVTRTKER